MIRNLLYSISFHLLILAIIFISFNFHNRPKEDKTSKITVSFANVPAKHLNDSEPEKTKEEQLKKEQQKDEKPQKEPKKKVEKSEPKKAEKKAEKAPPKTEEKTKAKDVKIDNNQKQKSANEEKNKEPEIKKPEPKKEEPKKEEAKKEDPKKEEVKKKEAPKPVQPAAQPTTEAAKIDATKNDPPAKKSAYDMIIDKKEFNNLDLSVREKFNVQMQIRQCYRMILERSKSSNKVPVRVYVHLEPDGSINLNSAVFQDFEKYNDPASADLRSSIDNVRKALSFCSPLRNLPRGKYNIWKDVDLLFEATDAKNSQ